MAAKILGSRRVRNKVFNSKEKMGNEEIIEIELKEFFWDQFLIYIATAIGLSTALDISFQLFSSTGSLKCNVPIDVVPWELTRDNAAYVNTFCLDSLPLTEYYSVIILFQGIIFVVPHYIWSSIFSGRFDFFVALVNQLERFRDRDTAEYCPTNFYIVQKLERNFLEARIIHIGYIIKLCIQCFVILVSIVINASIFSREDFSFVFSCPRGFDNNTEIPGWSLPIAVECTYPSFRLLSIIQISDYVLLVLAFCCALWGLVWYFVGHPDKLGYKAVADFAFYGCLDPEDYDSKPITLEQRICNDLDFLVMRLFRADLGQGNVFKDIQVSKELKEHTSKAFFDPEHIKKRNPDTRTLEAIISDSLTKYECNTKGFACALSFGSLKFGTGFILSSKFKNIPVLSVNFNPFLDDNKTLDEVFQGLVFKTFGKHGTISDDQLAVKCKAGLIEQKTINDQISKNNQRLDAMGKESSGLNLPKERSELSEIEKDMKATIKELDTLQTQSGKNNKKLSDLTKEVMNRNTALIVIGPFTEEIEQRLIKVVKAGILNVEKQYTKLLVLTPTKIGGKDVSRYFGKYSPTQGFVRELGNVNGELQEKEPVRCGNINCEFEMCAYIATEDIRADIYSHLPIYQPEPFKRTYRYGYK